MGVISSERVKAFTWDRVNRRSKNSQETDLNQHGNSTLNIDSHRWIQSTRKNISYGRAQLHVQNFDPQGEIREAKSHHFWKRAFCHLDDKIRNDTSRPQIKATYLGLVPHLGEEVKTQAVPDATCATTSLRGIALGYEGFHQPTELPLLVESILEN
jgi:hypothetical protein